MEIVFITKQGNSGTDSLKVAAKFGKRHASVLRAIRKILQYRAENQGEHILEPSAIFYLTHYVDEQGKQRDLFKMNRAAFSLLVMGFSGKKAAAFKEDFVAEFDRMEAALRLLQNPSPVGQIGQHTAREVQVQNSKGINSYMYEQGGTNAVVVYNRKNCEIHTGKRPSVLKKEAKEAGLPAKQRTSGKEVARHTNKPAACAMSLTDSFVQRGASFDQAAALGVQAMPIFAGMLALGITPAELSM